ncbi:MAG: A/G-specific adenine glycosylase [Bacilli bacterium]
MMLSKQVDELLINFSEIEFQHDLIRWFEKEQRDLPWRKTGNPYHIWISEVMLQQTRVDTVIPYFNIFTKQFPTITDLANAEEEKVLKAWEGLGYYSRARNLHHAIKEVEEKYAGEVPNNPKQFSDLKGVGPYTTGAVMSIAYNRPEPAVDGNVMRVISRILSIWDDIAKPSTRKIFEEVIKRIISIDNPSFFNQGLMELGALICTPKSPSCMLCPVNQHCKAFEQGTQKELPVKAKKKQAKALQMVAGVFVDKQGRFLVNKRPSEGLLANLWEFPNVEVENREREKEALIRYCKEQYGVDVKIQSVLPSVKHVFSHLIWGINVYSGIVESIDYVSKEAHLLKKEDVEQLAISVSHQKILKSIASNDDTYR